MFRRRWPNSCQGKALLHKCGYGYPGMNAALNRQGWIAPAKAGKQASGISISRQAASIQDYRQSTLSETEDPVCYTASAKQAGLSSVCSGLSGRSQPARQRTPSVTLPHCGAPERPTGSSVAQGSRPKLKAIGMPAKLPCHAASICCEAVGGPKRRIWPKQYACIARETREIRPIARCVFLQVRRIPHRMAALTARAPTARLRRDFHHDQ